ncbi:MAG: helix-turn-helix domain-containing protein [Anaerolineales bacterium]|nr:helix-turn-helix domain-containing protein [Anaerolineales bacterium]
MTFTPGEKLSTILQLAFSENIRWLTGEELSDSVKLKWVVTSLLDWQPGDVLLLPVVDFGADIVSDAVKKSVPVIVIVGQKPLNDFPEVDSRIPTIFIQTDKEPSLVQRRLIQFLTNYQAAILERGLQIRKKLVDLAVTDVQMRGLARAMFDISGKSVLIQDKRLNVLADFPAPDFQSIWSNVINQLISSDQLPLEIRNRQEAGKHPKPIFQQINPALSRLVIPIVVGDMARGFLSLICTLKTFDKLDELVAEEGAVVCAVEMSRTKAVRETEKKLQRDLLSALLKEDLSPRDAAMWIETMGMEQTNTYTAMQFSWDSPNPPSQRRLETLIHGEMVRLGLNMILNPVGDKLICFVQEDINNTYPETALNFGNKVFEQSKVEFPKIGLRCGVSTLARSLNEWHRSFREAGQALEMGTRLQEDKPVYYPDLSIYRLLLLIENEPETSRFYHDFLGKLIQQDNDNQLLMTLEAYFQHQGNLTQTAEALFIHRNTLSYRLDKISEITGLDLDNPDIVLALQLALRLHRMKRRKG